VKRDALVVAGGLAVLVASALPVDPQRISALERAVFRAVNGGPQLPSGAVWIVMQLGMIGVVPASALLAFALHRHRLALSLLVAGATAYAGGKAVKRVVERGRPDELLDDVRIQGAAAHGLGFVSGHAAVAFALATVLWPELARRDLRVLAVAVAALVALARVHVGAHLPLDVVGGAGLGVAAGGLARLALARGPACS
jgi:undecaprenyl-diphosphatase